MARQIYHCNICLWLLSSLALSCSLTSSLSFTSWYQRNKDIPEQRCDLEYDLVIIGAGASGLFASGIAGMLGSNTLLLDIIGDNKPPNVGGDCTNSACVPSKAVRSIGRLAVQNASEANLIMARAHATWTVKTVRKRENPLAMVDRNPHLDLVISSDCHFNSPHQITVNPNMTYSSSSIVRNMTKSFTVRSKRFLIATGASPVVPNVLRTSARKAGLPLYTYRSFFLPEGDQQIPDPIWNLLETKDGKRRVVIAGGGATGCEIGQSLARLGGDRLEVLLVAPHILPGEDVTIQQAALKTLSTDSVRIFLGRRVAHILENKQIQLSTGELLPAADAIIVCVGRKPSLSTLSLEAACVKWDQTLGVLVDPRNLQSISNAHVYACGDCCSAVNSKPTSRTAAHAAWTGYHAVSNMKVPSFLRIGSKSIHPVVPRVVYTDPELAMIGLSSRDCVKKYGANGFQRLYVPEIGTDRADMERCERKLFGFVEIRATKLDGKILGFTGCGPAASELANEIGLAIVNGLTVVDIARSLHSYPSYGYLMHRVALSMAFSNIWGVLESYGHVGGFLAKGGRFASRVVSTASRLASPARWSTRHLREWEARGERNSILFYTSTDLEKNEYEATIEGNNDFQLMRYSEVYQNDTLRALCTSANDAKSSRKFVCLPKDIESFASWVSNKP